MKYLKLYEQFRLIKEAVSKKNLILFSGPSASGKSTLAKNLVPHIGMRNYPL
jgi:guanylate kinase